MRTTLLGKVILALVVLATVAVTGRTATVLTKNSKRQEEHITSAPRDAVTFKDDIGPLLKEKCSPCHFDGGKVFDRYPFDNYETVRKLGKRLNTRLKGENADLVKSWIESGYPDKREEGSKNP